MNLRTLSSIALLCLASASSAMCSTLQVTESGVTGTGDSYGFSFLMDSSPVIKSYSAHNFTEPVIQNFQYTLNGATTSIPNAAAVFTAQGTAGILYVCFSDPCPNNDNYFDLIFGTPYLGSEASPSFVTGSFRVIAGNYGFRALTSTSNINITAVAATPEPSSFFLLGTGVLGVAGVLRRKLA